MAAAERIPQELWTGNGSPPKKDEVLSQVADFLSKLGYDKTLKALKKEGITHGVQVDALTTLLPGQGLLDMWVSAAQKVQENGSDSSDSESTSSSEASDTEEEKDDEDEKMVDDEAEETDDNGSRSGGVTAGQKRKRAQSSSSSSSEDESSSASSESSDSDDESSSSSGSDSDSSSSSDSSTGRPAKRTKVESDNDSSSNSSSSSSSSSASSSSDSDSDNTESDSSESDSESSAKNRKSVKSAKKTEKSLAPKAVVKPALENGHTDSSTSSRTIGADSPAPEAEQAQETLVIPVSHNGDMHPDRLKRLPATQDNIKQLKKGNVPFQRIPSNTQVDPRFSSNEYVSYDYADRAYQDLVVTKGKGFTKEKNKKKRGSYRGGAIDLTPKGIKFED